MTAVMDGRLAAAGIDAVALKPSEMDLSLAQDLPVSTLTVDYEGRDHVPAPETLGDLAGSFDCRVTVPVRADGFDPLGETHLRSRLPDTLGEVLVAGHGAYLTAEEQRRAVAPRLQAAAADAAQPWVGTEGVERIALAVGGTQFELLSATTERDVRALRAAGFDGNIALYAPAVLTDEDDVILDAVGEYTARRGPVRRSLPDDVATDSSAPEGVRERLLNACRDFALVGSPEDVGSQIEQLQSAGVDTVVAYPARGLGTVH